MDLRSEEVMLTGSGTGRRKTMLLLSSNLYPNLKFARYL